MKKVYILFALLLVGFSSFSQAVSNPGMESWRTGVSGGVGFPPGPVIPIAAPTDWFGFDSLTIALGETYGSLAGFGSDWKAQLFQENTIVHAGSASAKVITLKQDSLGFWAGLLSNAQAQVDVTTLLAGGDPMEALSFTGGTPVTLRITTVSAWVEYFAGKDETTGMMGGPDEGVMTVQAVAIVGGADSIIGNGVVNITPCSTFTQFTANLTYTTHMYDVSLVRIIFASSGGSGSALDSSTMYVDDITMTGEPQGVNNITGSNSIISVFPNPAKDELYMSAPVGNSYSVVLSSVNGQTVATKSISGRSSIDLSALPVGMYFYNVTDVTGTTVQRGKVNVTH